MKTMNKKEIKSSVDKALASMLEDLKISQPSKKTVKAVSKASKAIKKELKASVKKQARKAK